MKINSYVTNLEQLNLCIAHNVAEVILEPIELARFGKLSTAEVNDLANAAKAAGIQVALEWDVLMTEDEFPKKIEAINEINFTYIDNIRVQDVGAINYALENLSSKITLILETGNHNLKSVQTWIDAIGDRLNKIVLSIELAKSTLQEYIQKLSCPVEFLAVGRILLFYTPRNLLSALTPQTDDLRQKVMTSPEFLEATGESEESPHKGFPIVENRHGTFMFHIKRLFLLDHINELKEMGLAWARFDLRFDEYYDIETMMKIESDREGKAYKSHYPHDVIKGYYNINKTDVLFKKLKNYRIQRKDESYIGEVIEASKGNYMALTVKKHDISIGDELKFITPEGKEMFCKVHFLKNSKFEDIQTAKKGQLCLINYFGGIWVKSQVYLNLPTT
jgi:putative protease